MPKASHPITELCCKYTLSPQNTDPQGWLHSTAGRMSVLAGELSVLHSTYSWQMTTYVEKLTIEKRDFLKNWAI